MEFSELNLHPDLMRGIEEAGYKTCMPVQEKVFPNSFLGKDIYAQSQTGTGKTAAFLVSIFQRILTVPEDRSRKVLILSPTRELAVQTEGEAEKLGKYAGIKTGAFYGGVAYGPQVDMLRNDVQMIIGTPGRIIDLVQQGKMLLNDVGFLVIDEADRMFDMGFIDDLRKLIRYLPAPGKRQTYLFSATLGLRIKDLAWEYMIDPVEITIEPEHVTVDLVTQELYHVGSQEKMSLLLGLLDREKPESAIIFCNQKFMVEELARRLRINGYDCEYLMGDLPQSQRLEILEDLKSGKLRFLVATDVAARGLDIEALDLVINYDLPDEAESYVHRIGRTARAGKSGKAISMACEKFVYNLPAIERFLGTKIPVMPFDESLLLQDKSAGMRIPRSSDRRDGSRRDSSRGRDSGHRDGSRGRDSSRGHDSSRRDSSRGGERYGSDERRDGNRRPAPAGERRDGGRRDGPSLSEQPRAAQRPAGSRPSQRPGSRAPAEAASGAAQGPNPYAMSQDERLQRYKEKYGQPAEKQPQQGGRPAGQQRGAQGGSPRQGGRPQGGRPQGERAQNGRSENTRSQQAARPQGQRKGSSQKAAPAPKPGILDRIKGLFGGKKK
jgi:ATP-dependent RNA helicase RhlB